MAKFKIGDTLKLNSNAYGNYQIKVTNFVGLNYEVEIVNPGTSIGIKGQIYIDSTFLVDRDYTLVQSSHLYLVGDELEANAIPGFLIRIVSTSSGLYEYQVIQSQPNCTPVNAILKDAFSIVEPCFHLYKPATTVNHSAVAKAIKELDVEKTKTYIPKCYCDSKLLFQRGCKCGAVKPYKMRMS